MFIKVELKEDVGEIYIQDLHNTSILLTCQSRVCEEKTPFIG